MRRLLAFLPLLSLIAGLGCSSSTDPVDVETGGNQPTNPGDDLLVGDDGTRGNAPADARTCLGETHQAEERGLDIFVMLDVSSSMGEQLPRASLLSLPPTKWDAVKQSLESFVQAPESADIGMGLQYFPQLRPGVPDECRSNADCGAAGGPCTASVCVTGFANNDPANPLSFIGPANPDCQGDECICASDAACGGNGAVCRGMAGFCIVPGQGVPQLPVPPLCNGNADCAGLPGTACDLVGVCDGTLALGDPTFCLSTLGCPAGAGNCIGIPNTCLGQTLCEADVYGTPAVPISSDATRSTTIIQSLEAVQLQGLTPTGPALRGALDHARAWALEHPERQVVTVFATDGLPTECTPQGGADIALIAANANAGADPVRTFVIGVFGAGDLGDGRTLLDSLARAGGSERAFVINTGDNVGAEFLQALNQIRDTAVSCEFQLDDAAALDFDQVNLRISDPAGNLDALSNVGDVSACGGDQGWYYVRNDNGTPTQIQVCPSTCTRLTTTSGISAELEVGCATRIR